jgi:hypothetical protein
MEEKVLTETVHSKEDRKALLQFLVGKAAGAVAAERIKFAGEGKTEQGVDAATIALRKRILADLIHHETEPAKQRLQE